MPGESRADAPPNMRMERTGLTAAAIHDDLAVKVVGYWSVPCQSRPAAHPRAVGRLVEHIGAQFDYEQEKETILRCRQWA